MNSASRANRRNDLVEREKARQQFLKAEKMRRVLKSAGEELKPRRPKGGERAKKSKARRDFWISRQAA